MSSLLNCFLSSGPAFTQVPDQKVTDKENDNLREVVQLGHISLTLGDWEIPIRPSYGVATKSNTIHLQTNFFHLTLNPAQKLFRYYTDIYPEIKGARKRHQFLDNVFEGVTTFRELGHTVATDYKTIIISASKLTLGDTDRKTFSQIFREDIGQTARANAIEHSVRVTLTGEVPLERLLTYINSKPTEVRQSTAVESAIQPLNIVIANHPNRENGVFKSDQNKFFHYPEASQYPSLDIGGGLIGVRGYYSSVRPSTSMMSMRSALHFTRRLIWQP